MVLNDRGVYPHGKLWRAERLLQSNLSNPWLDERTIAYVTGGDDSSLRSVLVKNLRSGRIEEYECPGRYAHAEWRPPRSRRPVVDRLCREFPTAEQ
jgi:hypothetical protein